MRIRIFFFLTAMLLMAGLLAACHGTSSAKQSVIQFSFDQNSFPVKPWKFDASHMITAHGKLLVNGNPVVHASVQVGDQRTLQTDDNGNFEVQVDQSKLTKLPINIKQLDQATLSGKPIAKELEQQLTGTSAQLTVYYPIEISKVEPSADHPGQVNVYGQAKMQGGASFPTLLVDKYSIYGVIKDAAGNPVPNATVSIRRSGVEGFAKSTPSKDNGAYSLVYVPEEDEDTYLQVHVGDTHYQLPDNKVYHFPEETSVETNITLPAIGTVIDDKPPTLVSTPAPGAVYKGTLIGLKVNDSVVYQTTIPKQNGSFILTLSKEVWDQSPVFFETEMSQFLQKPISPGDMIPSTFIQKPGQYEPDQIVYQSLK